MNWINIRINVDHFPKIQSELLEAYRDLRFELEDGLDKINAQEWANMKEAMVEILIKSYDWKSLVAGDAEPRNIVLHHPGPTVLNLPWQEANPGLDWELVNYPNLFFSYSNVPITDAGPVSLSPLPLRVLVLISSPLDHQGRLDYEKEEAALREAFFPLEQAGIAELVITSSGSLEALERELNNNSYHILHFSGHGHYLQNQPYLLMEDPHTLFKKEVPAADLIQTIRKSRFGKDLQLAFLGACQTARGEGDAPANQGLAQQLIHAGIPAVVAMSMAVLDTAATAFSTTFYRGIVKGLALPEAVHAANQSVSQMMAASESGNELQRSIPRLYLGRKVERLFNPNPKEARKAEKKSFLPLRKSWEIKGLPEEASLTAQGLHFYGRRKAIEKAIQGIRDEKGIAVRGFRGVGKTAFAVNIGERLNAQYDVYYFDVATQAPEKAAQRLGLGHYRADSQHPANEENFQKPHLLLLDNYDFLILHPEGKDQWDGLIEYLAAIPAVKLILISTYETELFPKNDLVDLPLPHPPTTDFRQKFLDLCGNKRAGKGASAIASKVEEACCGNYGLLHHLFDKAEKEGQGISDLLMDERENKKYALEYSLKAFLHQLIQSLEPEVRKALFFLGYHPTPVTVAALKAQPVIADTDINDSLDILQGMALIEQGRDEIVGEQAWYVPDIIFRYLGVENLRNDEKDVQGFSQEAAGRYYADLVQKHDQRGHLEAAYKFAFLSKNKKLFLEVGPTWVDHLYGVHQYELARKMGEELCELLGSDTPTRLHNRLAITYRNLDRIGRSIEHYRTGIRKAGEEGDEELLLTLRSNYARVLTSAGRNQEAMQVAEEALSDALYKGNTKAEAVLYQTLAFLQVQEKSAYSQAIEYAQKAEHIYREEENWAGAAATLAPQIEIHLRQGNLPKARQLLDEGLELAALAKDPNIKARIQLINAKEQYIKGKYDEALSVLRPVVSFSTNSGDVQLQNEAQSLISRIQDENKEEILIDSLKKAQKTGNIPKQLHQANTLAAHYLKEDNPAKAKRALEQWALPALNSTESLDSKSSVYNNLGMAYKYLGQPGEAYRYLQEAYELAHFTKNIDQLYNTSYNLGQLFYGLSRLPQALDFLFEAAKHARNMENLDGELELLMQLAPLSNQLGDFEKSRYIQTRIDEIWTRIPKYDPNEGF
ncbi:MAG: CHAT domain-containing protein [Lewinellaceae bacterium]|nr:CHAT domain-containing protein [Phaeodactylibacter sp.]MCB9347595.1 CHAT domain-containing protein [Lewinellaceae bacterium]